MDKNNKPLVSYIMTAKNFEQFIVQAIESILNQTYKNIELILVDDASTDKTTEIIRDYSSRYSNIVPIFNKISVLPPQARNMAARIARGKYLSILDSDDISLPNRTEVQVNFMESHPEILACGSHAEIIDINGKKIAEKKKSRDISDIRYIMLFQNQFIHSSMIIKRDVFDKLNGYREEYMHAEDYDLCSRILEIGPMTNIDMFLIKFRAQSGGVTTQFDSQKIQRLSSLKVTQRNMSLYISLSQEKILNLTDTLNNKKVSLLITIVALISYRKLTYAYLKINVNLKSSEIKSILNIFRSKRKVVLISYFKRLCKIN